MMSTVIDARTAAADRYRRRLLAGVNMFAFHHLVAHDMSDWQTPDTTPALAKTAGAISMLLWIGVVICGRWIGFL